MNPIQIEQVAVGEREQWVATHKAVQLDVREPVEWATGTIEGAVQISMESIPESISQLDQDTPVLVICRSGGRSQRVAEFLVQQGFSAANLSGGMMEVVKWVGR